jgi:U3 small nucleolar RNA-associated protein 20
MMPLVRSFLDNEMYHKYAYLIDEACGSIGAICYVLAWPKYAKLLDYYVGLLPKNVLNQKLIIKILVNILDAFHFDLRLSKHDDYFTNRKGGKLSQQVEDCNGADNDEDNANEKEDEQSVSDQIVPLVSSSSGFDNNKLVRRKKMVGSVMATKIHSTITKTIIPMLFNCLTKRLKSDSEHKVNKHENEDEQILRVPMALAILKLLNNLPAKTLEVHLPGLLFKVCDMLKSRAISVRNTTRDCLMKMIESLPDKKYYFYVFKELSNCLLRGYQVHVLCFTVYMILKSVQDKLSVGDLDASLGLLMSSVRLELFSDVADEKEVKQIVAKIMEAKTVSSYNTLELLAKFVSKERFLDIVRLFKEQLDTCNSRKLIKKIEEALRRILLGSLANPVMNTETLMGFTHGLVHNTFEQLNRRAHSDDKPGRKINFDEDKLKETDKMEHKSCLIIQREAKRGGEKPKVLDKTNQHVLIEFALQVFFFNLIYKIPQTLNDLGPPNKKPGIPNKNPENPNNPKDLSGKKTTFSRTSYSLIYLI